MINEIIFLSPNTVNRAFRDKIKCKLNICFLLNVYMKRHQLVLVFAKVRTVSNYCHTIRTVSFRRRVCRHSVIFM